MQYERLTETQNFIEIPILNQNIWKVAYLSISHAYP